MGKWLVKSEPSTYSWEQLVKEKKTTWDGVRNYAARLNLRAMKKGDEVLFYHSNEGMEIVGIAKIAREAYQDPSTEDPAWVAVDIRFHRSFKKPVSLSVLKADKRLTEMDLIRLGRLSVQKVTDEQWDIVLGLGGLK